MVLHDVRISVDGAHWCVTDTHLPDLVKFLREKGHCQNDKAKEMEMSL